MVRRVEAGAAWVLQRHRAPAHQPQPTLPGSRLLVFGGQTEHACELNDAHSLDLAETAAGWRQLSPPRLCSKHYRREFEWGRGGRARRSTAFP